MNRVWIYSLGWGVLAICVAISLPRRAQGLESMLRSQIEARLAAAGLSGFAVTIDGQRANLAYRDDAALAVAASGESPRDRMQRAVVIAGATSGGLPDGPAYGGVVMGPVTRVNVDGGSVDLIQMQVDSAATRASMVEQAEKAADDCTDRVIDAVADRRLRFVSGSAELTGDSQAILIDIYNTIQSCPGGLVLRVEGHTDNVGQEADNMKLSTARAEAAAFVLIDLGLAQASVTSRGFGPKDPIADNTSEEGRAKNRRVDFILRPRDAVEGP